MSSAPSILRGSETGRCSRWLALKLMGKAAKPFSPKQQTAIDDSASQEALIVASLEKDGHVITDSQREITLDYNRVHVVGHIDGIANHEHLLEIKALGQFLFDKITRHPLIVSHPVYYMQVQTYLFSLMEQDNKIKDAWFVCKNKNTGEIKRQTVELDADAIGRNMERLQEVLISAKLGEPPEESCAFGEHDYRWCGYNAFCHEGKEQPVIIPEAEVYDAVDLWRRAKIMQDEADEMMKRARDAFEGHMKAKALTGAQIAGLKVTYTERSRVSWNEDELKKRLPELELAACKNTRYYRELRVTEGGS